MEKQERLNAIKEIIVETMNENYRNYGQFNNLSQEEVDKLINDNAMGVGQMADIVAEKIDSKLFA